LSCARVPASAGAGGRKLAFSRLSAKLCQMKTIATREFLRRFKDHKKTPCLVKDRGEVLGSWTPSPSTPPPVDFAKRARQDCPEKLPFTFAELLKEGKKR
jgi:hypothetical protein